MFSPSFVIMFNIFLYIICPLGIGFVAKDTWNKTKEAMERGEDFE